MPSRPVPALGPVLLGLVLMTSPAVVHAQDGEAVGREAQAITVRLEGATQGSGVLVGRQGNRYTVLTAWHVVRDQQPGEEVAILTADGRQHRMEQGSGRRVGMVDMAVLTFTSDNNYRVATIGDPRSVALSSAIYVSGYPLANQTIPGRTLTFAKGDVVANGTADMVRSQLLLYRNPTLPGMSGGAVLNARGELVGIHLNAVRADQISEIASKAIAIQMNQGLAIDAFQPGTAATSSKASAAAPPPATQASTPSVIETQDRLENTPFSDARLRTAQRYGLTIEELLRLELNSFRPMGSPLKGHTDWVYSVAFSPDGRRIISGSSDNTLRLWDASSGHPIEPPLQGHTDTVTSVAFSPDGRRIVSGSWDETLRLWGVATGR